VTGISEAPTPRPPSAEARIPNNLPRERTRFIGRERELAECARLLGEARLVTVTGIGGSGKTRLALKVAESLLETHPDGVWFVDLAPLTEGSRVAETVASPLGVREVAGKDLTETLSQQVREKRLLLVLDNCEHLLSACAELADALLSAGEEVRILTTSRERLGIEGERLFELRSLAVPSVEMAGDLPAVEASEAVRLFVDRAQFVLPGFALTEKNAAAVSETCRRLDGIPLAIELAAARVRTLSVDQIRARLDDRFRLLTSGSRTALQRHQTLRATIQWSYDQLSVEEQRLFRLLSVFAGGWTLESARRVAGKETDEFEVMDLLARLVDKSLVLVERERSTEPRYGLLETVRQYAKERLTEAGDAQAVRRRHVEEFLAIAERAYAQRFVQEEQWAAALELEHDNLRAALDLLRDSDPERHLQLAGALAWFWQVRSHLLEGREHLTAALAGSSPDPPRPARARALWGAANTIAWQGDGAAALPVMEDALRMWRDLADLGEIAIALEGIGWAQLLGGNDQGARSTFEECLRLQRERGDPVLVNRAMVALAQALVGLAEVSEARALSSQIIAFSKPRGDRRNEHFGWHYLADCALIEGKCEESLALYRESLRLARIIGDRLETSFEVQGVAMSLAGLGDLERALRLAASAKAEWERIGADVHMRFWDALLDRYLGGARRTLGADAAEHVWKEGRLIPFDEAIAIALDDRSRVGTIPAASEGLRDGEHLA
jgi:non-specific serine/threonine protein kinase